VYKRIFFAQKIFPLKLRGLLYMGSKSFLAPVFTTVVRYSDMNDEEFNDFYDE